MAALPSSLSFPKKIWSGGWAAAASVSLLVAIAAVSPFFFLGTASGHDVEFHMASWLDAAGQWKQGVAFPRWAEWANYGFGEPRFIFYPPLSWLFGALLGSLIPWYAVAAVFVICVQTLAGISAYALLRGLAESRWAALFGAACFAANPYALVIIYARSDFAELLAMAFFPLLFLTAFRLSGFSQRNENTIFPDSIAFGLCFCAVWLSNAPAAVIGTYSVGFLFVFAALRDRSWRTMQRGAAGMLLGFGLAAFYLLPAFYEQRWVNISGVLTGGLTPTDNFLFAKTADAEHDAFNRVVSNITVALAAWVVVTALASWYFRRRDDADRRSRGVVVPVLSALAIVVLLLMTPVTSLLWRFLPELRFVQFPWRWLSVLVICLVVFTATSAVGKLRWTWFGVALLVCVVSGRYLALNTWWDTEDMPTLQAAIQNGVGFEGTDEYDPLGDDHTDLPQKEPRARFVSEDGSSTEGGSEIVVDQWDAEYRLLRVTSQRPCRLALRLLDFPAWAVRVNGELATIEYPRGTGQMIIPVPAGESKVEIKFRQTMDRAIGGWISVCTLWGSFCAVVLRRYQPPIADS